MRNIRLSMTAVLLISLATGLKSVDAAAPSPADDLLRKARSAMGGEDKLNGIHSLSASGYLLLPSTKQWSGGAIEINYLLPDKFSRATTESWNNVGGDSGGSFSTTTVDVLNGDVAWTDFASASGGGGHDDGDQEFRLQLQADFVRYLLVWTLHSSGAVPLQFNDVGSEAVSGSNAAVIEAKGNAGLSMRIFLDTGSHLPLMLRYRAKPPLHMPPLSYKGSPAEAQKQATAMMAKMPKLAETNLDLHLSDYRTVDGIQFPYSLKLMDGGMLLQEWKISKYVLNPPLTAKHFESQERRR